MPKGSFFNLECELAVREIISQDEYTLSHTFHVQFFTTASTQLSGTPTYTQHA